METAYKVSVAIFVALLVILGSFIAIAAMVHGKDSANSDAGQWKYMKISIPSHEFSYVAMFFVYNEENPNSNAVIDGNKIYLGNDSDFPFDVRFCYEKDPTKVLPQFADHSLGTNGVVYNKTVTLFYVKIPANLTTIYLFYNHTGATFYSNGSAVFDLFDDFNSNDLQNYTVSYGTNTGTASAIVDGNFSYLHLESYKFKSVKFRSKKYLRWNRGENYRIMFVAKFNLIQKGAYYSMNIGLANESSDTVYFRDEDWWHGNEYNGYVTTFYGLKYATPSGLSSVNGQQSSGDLLLIQFNATSINYIIYKNDWTVQQQNFKKDTVYPTLNLYPEFDICSDFADTSDGRWTKLNVDYYGVVQMQNTVNTYNETGIGTVNYVPPNPSGGAGDTGSTSSDPSSSSIFDYLNQIKNFILQHALTVIFAIMSAFAFFNGRFKEFIFIVALAAISYFILDAYAAQYLTAMFGGR